MTNRKLAEEQEKRAAIKKKNEEILQMVSDKCRPELVGPPNGAREDRVWQSIWCVFGQKNVKLDVCDKCANLRTKARRNGGTVPIGTR